MLTKEYLNKYFEPKNFFNREMSWLDFNRRVLDEALNPDLPLLDKIKFLSIFFSNLDEFYMIRISGLKEQIRANVIEPSIDGATPIEQVRKIEKEIQPMLNLIYNFWKEEIVPQLAENNVFISSVDELNDNEKEHLKDYFNREIYPVLTPLAFDPGRPFPYISNLSLSFAILIKKQNAEKHFARVKVPNILPRLLRIENIVNPGAKPSTNGSFCAKYVWLEDLIRHNLPELFPGVEILNANAFRITRNTDI
jgi:polyphosphate kinase